MKILNFTFDKFDNSIKKELICDLINRKASLSLIRKSNRNINNELLATIIRGGVQYTVGTFKINVNNEAPSIEVFKALKESADLTDKEYSSLKDCRYYYYIL